MQAHHGEERSHLFNSTDYFTAFAMTGFEGGLALLDIRVLLFP